MYKLSRYTSYIEKNNIYAVYCNFNLYFFKGKTYQMFKKVLENNPKNRIDKDFIQFLREKEILVLSGEDNV